MIALSTCWQSPVAQSGRDLAARLKSMGFDEVELEYRITPEMYAELLPEIEAGAIHPVSIHNYFPAPKVAPQPGGEVWSFSSEDAEERLTAVDYTKRAIELAGEVGARAVIVHCGQITMDPRTNELRELFDGGQIETRTGRRVIDEIRAEREAKKEPPLKRVQACLEQLTGTAEKAGVKIGLENRYYAHEIPSSDDLTVLLEAVGNDCVGYWHDVGHAAVQENLGLDSQTSLLGRFRDKTIGVHLHDVRGYDDHLAPGTGEVDFAFIKENLPPDVIQVLEVQPSVTPTQMRAGLAHLAKAGIS